MYSDSRTIIRIHTGEDTPHSNEPKLTVQQLLEIESCKDYIKTSLQTLDGTCVNQPKHFRPVEIEFENNRCCLEVCNTSDSTTEFQYGHEVCIF